MDTPLPQTKSNFDYRFEDKLKTLLSGWGINELYTYSFVSQSLALKSTYPVKNHLKLKNPFTTDWVYMRRSLIPSLAQVINDNQNPNVSVFEIQNVYHPKINKSSLPTEQLQLAIVTTQKFKFLKGILDALFNKLFVGNLKLIPQKIDDEPFLPQTSGLIRVGKKNLGSIGRVKNSHLFALKLLLKPLYNISSTHPTLIPISSNPPIIEDLTFTLKPKTYLGEILEEISLTSKLIQSVTLKDSYQQNHTFTIAYQHPQRNLTDKEIAPIRKKIVSNLKKSFSTILVGNLQD